MTRSSGRAMAGFGRSTSLRKTPSPGFPPILDLPDGTVWALRQPNGEPVLSGEVALEMCLKVQNKSFLPMARHLFSRCHLPAVCRLISNSFAN